MSEPVNPLNRLRGISELFRWLFLLTTISAELMSRDMSMSSLLGGGNDEDLSFDESMLDVRSENDMRNRAQNLSNLSANLSSLSQTQNLSQVTAVSDSESANSLDDNDLEYMPFSSTCMLKENDVGFWRNVAVSACNNLNHIFHRISALWARINWNVDEDEPYIGHLKSQYAAQFALQWLCNDTGNYDVTRNPSLQEGDDDIYLLDGQRTEVRTHIMLSDTIAGLKDGLLPLDFIPDGVEFDRGAHTNTVDDHIFMACDHEGRLLPFAHEIQGDDCVKCVGQVCLRMHFPATTPSPTVDDSDVGSPRK